MGEISNAASLLLHHGWIGGLVAVVIWGTPQVTDFAERILPLLSDRCCDRAIRLAKVKKNQSK